MMSKWPLIALAALAASVATTNVQALTVNFASDEFTISTSTPPGTGQAGVSGTSSVNTTARENGFEGFFTDDADGFVLLGADGSDPNISASPATGAVQASSQQQITFSSGLIGRNKADIDFDFALQGNTTGSGTGGSGPGLDILNGWLATASDPDTPVVGIPGLVNVEASTSSDLIPGVSVVDQSIDISTLNPGVPYVLTFALEESDANATNVAAGFDNISLTAIPEPATLGSSLGIAALMTGLLWVRRRGMRSV
jgi:hypothetical protein